MNLNWPLSKTIYSWNQWIDDQTFILQFLDACLRGIAQVVFMKNPITGLLILLGFFVQNSWVAGCALIGLMASTLTAIVLDLDEKQWRAGLFGFNGVLVGLACGTFLESSGSFAFSVMAISILLGIFSTLFQVFLNQLLTQNLKSSPLTFSFNLVFLLFVMAGIRYANTPLLAAGLPSKIDPLTSLDIGKGILRGISQIYLSDNLISAGLIILGMVIGSRVLTLWALLGSVTGTLTALALGVSKGNILAGLWQYNAVLGCMAIGGIFFLFSNRVFILAILCGVLCTLLTGTLAGLFPEGVPVTTLPANGLYYFYE